MDYRRADQPPIALIEDPPPAEESSSASPLPYPDLPADNWRNKSEGRGKGKRPPPQSASRQPAKYARSDDSEYPLVPSSRTNQLAEPVIPRPPNLNGAPEPALQTRSATLPKLTPGEAGVPAYKGDEYQPLNRKECNSFILLPPSNESNSPGRSTDIGRRTDSSTQETTRRRRSIHQRW